MTSSSGSPVISPFSPARSFSNLAWRCRASLTFLPTRLSTATIRGNRSQRRSDRSRRQAALREALVPRARSALPFDHAPRSPTLPAHSLERTGDARPRGRSPIPQHQQRSRIRTLLTAYREAGVIDERRAGGESRTRPRTKRRRSLDRTCFSCVIERVLHPPDEGTADELPRR